MASNGLLVKAKQGKCRLCFRIRTTAKLKAVGEMRHGFATGHIWECQDIEDCKKQAYLKIDNNHRDAPFIKIAIDQGPYTTYKFLH